MVAIKLNIFIPFRVTWPHVDTETQALDGDGERLTPFSEIDKPGEAKYRYNGQ